MSPAALPYSLLLLLAEFSIGGQLALFAVDLRAQAAKGFIKTGGALVSIGAALTLWLAMAIPPSSNVGGYALSERFFTPSRAALGLFLLLSLCYTVALFASRRRTAYIFGLLASLAGLLSLGLIAAIVQQPTWSLAGTYASLLFGGLALGGVTLAMSLGHWYLVTPRLPERPLNEMTVALLAVVVIQAILLTVNLAAPVRELPTSLGPPSGQNPALWLRIGVGLLLPLVLSFMAWQSSKARGMMSATGLLYLATGAVLAGEALACSLIFSTAIPG